MGTLVYNLIYHESSKKISIIDNRFLNCCVIYETYCKTHSSLTKCRLPSLLYASLRDTSLILGIPVPQSDESIHQQSLQNGKIL